MILKVSERYTKINLFLGKNWGGEIIEIENFPGKLLEACKDKENNQN